MAKSIERERNLLAIFVRVWGDTTEGVDMVLHIRTPVGEFCSEANGSSEKG